MEITLENFKSLISGLSADEMIDMMPEKLYNSEDEVDGGLPIYYKLGWTEKKIEYYYGFQTIKSFLYFEDAKHACTKMLLRLLTNNYLPSYQLVQDSRQKNN